jgi:hypothetical protein
MRLFLCFLIFDMVFRGLSVLYPWEDWVGELDMRRAPVRLPTLAECNSEPATPEVMRAVDSFWDFLKPWPEASARAKIHSWSDGGKWALCWLSTRLDLFENLVGFNNEWPMFSPSVAKRKYVARARLYFESGSEKIVRARADPEDLTNFSHWWEEKILDHELKVKEGEGRVNDVLGYCNLLSHRYPVNEAGSPLVRIRLFLVRLDLPEPGVNYREHYEKLNREPSSTYPDFYDFDVKARHGKRLTDKSD